MLLFAKKMVTVQNEVLNKLIEILGGILKC